MKIISSFLKTPLALAAAVMAVAMGFSAPARAEIVTVSFSGNFGEYDCSHRCFLDPNDGYSDLTDQSFSGYVQWDSGYPLNPGTMNVTFQTIGYGPLTMNGSLIAMGDTNPGEFFTQMILPVGPYGNQYSVVLDMFGPDILGDGNLPDGAQMASIAGAHLSFDANDFFYAADTYDLSLDVAAPEPASLALLGAGLAGLGMLRRRKRA